MFQLEELMNYPVTREGAGGTMEGWGEGATEGSEVSGRKEIAKTLHGERSSRRTSISLCLTRSHPEENN